MPFSIRPPGMDTVDRYWLWLRYEHRNWMRAIELGSKFVAKNPDAVQVLTDPSSLGTSVHDPMERGELVHDAIDSSQDTMVEAIDDELRDKEQIYVEDEIKRLEAEADGLARYEELYGPDEVANRAEGIAQEARALSDRHPALSNEIQTRLLDPVESERAAANEKWQQINDAAHEERLKTLEPGLEEIAGRVGETERHVSEGLYSRQEAQPELEKYRQAANVLVEDVNIGERASQSAQDDYRARVEAEQARLDAERAAAERNAGRSIEGR